MINTPGFTWKFQRQGGVDQVVLSTAEEICRLSELDPKLWTVLSCPASGLEFDSRTLALIDIDNDGRIRIPEVVEAVQWTCARLKDPSTMIDPPEGLPLSFINDQAEEGRHLLATARTILENLGKKDAEALSKEDVLKAVSQADKNIFNGDGILPSLDSLEPEVRQFIKDALAVMGGVEDATKQPGINQDIAEAFIQSLTDWRTWRKDINRSDSPLGADTPEAWGLMEELKEKIDDYFLRCEIASFAPGSTAALNADNKLTAPVEDGPLDVSILVSLPLARVAPERPLTISDGLNPAWNKSLERFLILVKPLLAEPEVMTKKDWLKIQDSFAAYASALVDKPALSAVEVTTPPTSDLDRLGAERIEEILSSRVRDRFADLAREDADTPAASRDIVQIERLVFYHRHLYRLLMNFVSFHDFYSEEHLASFQAGVLYLDGRSCSLCVPVDDVDSHAALATYSHLCLVYCECRRVGKEGPTTPDGTMKIVAAMTAGDSELLLVGRNGVFIDNFDNDWDATVVKVINNPIGLREAVWAPYQRVGRMISEQLERFASSKNDNLLASASQKISTLPTAQPPVPAAAPAGASAKPAFDIGRNVGIFAAIGLALGALGTALASITKSVLALDWWQLPLLVLAIFLLISGPSVLLAWLKLRRRTLGPFLEASGWAVNSGVSIDLTLSDKLTATAVLPPNSARRYNVSKRGWSKKWLPAVLLLILLLGLVFGWWWSQTATSQDIPEQTAVEVGVAGENTSAANPPGMSAKPAPASEAEEAAVTAPESAGSPPPAQAAESSDSPSLSAP